MSKHERFHLKSIEDLDNQCRQVGVTLPTDRDIKILFDPVAIGDRTTPNRFAIHPMEGFDAADDGSPQDLTFRRYTRYAEGGTGLIWFEATAVLNEARSNPRQLYMHEGNVDVYARLVEATRKAAMKSHGREPVLVVQLTHSGRYSKPTGRPAPIIAHRSPILDPLHKLGPDYPVVTDDYLDRLQDTFVKAAKLAAKAGFDGIDIKSCHRYLCSELLASFTREGKYGGSFENRTRLLRESLARVSSEVKSVFITCRMNAYDAIEYPYGFGVSIDDRRVPDLTEPIQLAREIKKLGAPLLNITIGNPYYNPHYGRPFDFPIKNAYTPDEHPLQSVARFMSVTRAVQEAIPDVPVVAAGYTWLRHLMPHVAAAVIRSKGATLIGQGRGGFAYPNSVHDLQANGKMDPDKCCVSCSACTQIMRDGGITGCVVRDNEIYGPQYRLARRFSLDRLTEEAKRCRNCESPTCALGCPAHVNIPEFIRAFADGDYARAYGVLRESNALPEMCAYVCPTEVQCEGNCIENIFCLNPIAIGDIQLETCRIARREGRAGVQVPAGELRGKVAVIGGGPAGLACAIRLIEKGFAVTIFEKESALGGTPDDVIPVGRYEKASAEIDAILAPAVKAGRVIFQGGKTLGKNLELEAVRKDFDAVFLAVGLQGSSGLGKADGVVDALAFLRKVKCGGLKSVKGKVAVLGAGNTAMDAAREAKRLGASDVYVVYRRSFVEMPAWPAERDAALKDGVHFMILCQPISYEKDHLGTLTGLRIARTELGDPDASGRRRPQVVPNSESVLEVSTVIEAMGQSIPDDLKRALKGVTFTKNELVETVKDSCATKLPKVFAGGDIVNGGLTAVRGVHEGMRAADEIERALVGNAK